MMNKVFIYQLLRVPTGKKGGRYKHIPQEDLVTKLLNNLKGDLIKENGEVQLAHSIGMMGNPVRCAVLNSNLSQNTVASTIDSQCGGTYKTLQSAFSCIKSKEKSWFVAGGMESSSLQSQRNYAESDPRFNPKVKQIETAPFAPFETLSLNDSAAQLAIDFDITKSEMIKWTVISHQRAVKSNENSVFKDFVLPINDLFKDEGIKENITYERLSKASSVNLIDRTTACSTSDGAGFILLGDAEFGIKNSIQPLAVIEAIVFVAFDPNESPKGCIYATEKLLKKYKVSTGEIDIFEVCESYAVKPLAFAKQFNVSLEKINVLGSNLAQGHPFAASGVINLTNLVCAMQIKKARKGLLSVGIAGGMGAAILISR